MKNFKSLLLALSLAMVANSVFATKATDIARLVALDNSLDAKALNRLKAAELVAMVQAAEQAEQVRIAAEQAAKKQANINKNVNKFVTNLKAKVLAKKQAQVEAAKKQANINKNVNKFVANLKAKVAAKKQAQAQTSTLFRRMGSVAQAARNSILNIPSNYPKTTATVATGGTFVVAGLVAPAIPALAATGLVASAFGCKGRLAQLGASVKAKYEDLRKRKANQDDTEDKDDVKKTKKA